jgi:hypothetical protein
MHPSDDDDITQDLTTTNLPRLVPIASNDTDCLLAVSRSESILTRSSSVISRESTSSNNSSSLLSTDMLQDELSGVFERKMEDDHIVVEAAKNKSTNDETNNDKEVCINDTIKQEQQQSQSKEEKRNETDDITEKETKINEENNQKQELLVEEMKVKVDIETMEKVNELLPSPVGNNGEKKEEEIEWISRLKEKENEGEKGDDTETVEDLPGCGVSCGVGGRVGAGVGTGVSSMQPLKMLRKGATAVVGGTMVGVGLVMIPLPTPFGAVVASGGLAVLGTEFTEAKELNERLIDGAKGHFNTARNALVKGIESMDQKDSNADSSTNSADAGGDIPSTNNTISKSSSEKDEAEGANTVIKLSASSSFGGDDGNENGNSEGNDDNNEDSTDDSPLWLHMNPIEQERQEKLAKERYRRENQTYYEQTKENLTKRTGKFLSRNILPLIKKKEVEVETEENLSTTGTNDDGNDNSDDPIVVVVVAKEEEEKETSLPNETFGTQTTDVTKTEEEVDNNRTVGEENDDGYVVISPKDDII